MELGCVIAEVNSENIMLSETSQSGTKDKYRMVPLYEVPRISKFLETEGRLEVTRGRGRRNGELLAVITEFLFEVTKSFWK